MEKFNLKIAHVASTESIFSQNDDFGKTAEVYVKSIVDRINNGAFTSAGSMENDSAVKMLEDAIFTRFKLKVRVITNRNTAAIMPFYSNVNHVFLPDIFRGNMTLRDQRRLLQTFNGKKGSVNLEKATVDGIFSEYEHPLYLNFFHLVKNLGMEVEEIVAIMLHELGHGFYACAMADRLDETNQVLASIARNIMDTQTGDFEYIFKELEKANVKDAKEVADKIVHGDRIIAGATLFKTLLKMVRSQMVDGTYNATSFEQRADNFAARFGYGRQLVHALEKIHKFAPEKNIATFFLFQLYTVGTTIGLIALLMLMITSVPIIGALLAIFYNFVWFTLFREDTIDYTYDKLKIRYTRIRQDAIDQLKVKDADPEFTKKLLEVISSLDAAIKSTKEVKYLPNLIANFVFPDAGKAKDNIDNQQLMEALASNDLFIKAAQIRTTESAKFSVGDSDIAGKGAFSSKKILKGERVGLAFKITGNSGDLDKDIHRTKLGAMVNHSSSPNLEIDKSGRKYYFIAKKDISKDSELTVDYHTFDFEGKRNF